MDYFYFAATLPELSLDQTAPMGYEEFSNLCHEHLSKRDLQILASLDSSGRTSNTFVRTWQDKNSHLRNSLVQVRASSLGRDPTPYLREHGDSDISIEKIVTEVYTHGTPRDRELTLDRFRWALAEELAQYDEFSINAILAYSIKLKLVIRWEKMDMKKGMEISKTLINEVVVALPSKEKS